MLEPAIVEHAGIEVRVVFRKAVLDRAAEDRQVASGRDLLGVGQAGGVAIDGPDMPSWRALRVIVLGEVILGACEVLGDDDRDIVGGLRDQRLDRILDLDGLARREAELRGGLGAAWADTVKRRVEPDPAGSSCSNSR